MSAKHRAILNCAAAILERVPAKTDSSGIVERALAILLRAEARRYIEPSPAANDDGETTRSAA